MDQSEPATAPAFTDGVVKGLAAFTVAFVVTQRTGLPGALVASLLGGVAIARPSWDGRRAIGVLAGLALPILALLPMSLSFYGF